MPSKPSSRMAAERRIAARQKRDAAYRQAVRYFRPRASERGSIVFLSARPKTRVVRKRGKPVTEVVEKAGTRLKPGSRRQGYAVYVRRDGKIIPYKARGFKRQPPKPLRQTSIDVREFQKRSRTAVKKWFAERRPQLIEKGAVTRKKMTREISFGADIVPEMAARLREVVANNPRSGVYLTIECALILKDAETGEMFNQTFEVDFKQSDVPDAGMVGFYEPFLLRKFYAYMAQSLAARGFVTMGSAQYVRNLGENKGQKDPRKWTKHGREWDKAEFQRMRIMAFDYKINQIKTISR